ncbi:MAG: hypothetical protein ACRCT8_13285 [Lacipirellulaceae bacterium]
MNDDINVLALVKGRERYLFLYDDSQQAEVLRALGRHASNPELSFTWYDAAILSKRVRSEARRSEVGRSRITSIAPLPESPFPGAPSPGFAAPGSASPELDA